MTWPVKPYAPGDHRYSVLAYADALVGGGGSAEINVQAPPFNAACDGVTDDTVAVALAYAALPANGGTLVFPTGACRFNLTINKTGVRLVGQGVGNVNTGLGATRLIPADPSIPVVTMGDGVATVFGTGVNDALLVGDGVNATGDGIRILGVSDVKLDNVGVSGFGRDGIRMESSATRPTTGVYMSAMMISSNRRSGLRLEWGAQYVTNIGITNSHINGWLSPTAHAIYLDSCVLHMNTTYVDIPGSGQGGVTMVKNFAPFPGIQATIGSFDNAGGAAADTLNVSTWLASGSRLTSAINGIYNFSGRVVYSDITVQQSTSPGSRLFIPHLHLPYVLNGAYFPLDETDTGTQVNIGRTGTSGGHFETLTVGGAARFRAAFATNRTAVVYSAAMDIVCSAGNQFDITVTDAVAFTINAPLYPTAGQEITIRIRNTTVGVLGVATWNAVFKMVAWVQPGAGTSRAIVFRYDGTNWVEVTRSAADIPN